ncbi:hypothetical protein GCM10009414_03300 [Tatumella terrea]
MVISAVMLTRTKTDNKMPAIPVKRNKQHISPIRVSVFAGDYVTYITEGFGGQL